jgi:5-methylcytosine-specific restriction endonuclease McrA
MAKRVPRTRGGGRYTEAAYRGFLRAGIRAKWMRWAPKFDCLNASRRKRQGSGRHKYEYQCAECGNWYLQKEVDVDHITPAGGFQTAEEFGVWAFNIMCESEKLQVLCKEKCHKAKTKRERKR